MATTEQVKARFEDLLKASDSMPLSDSDPAYYVDAGAWSKWKTSALHLLEISFGGQSAAFNALSSIPDDNYRSTAGIGIGIFLAAKEDYDRGLAKSIEQTISAEVFGSFVVLAKEALSQGYKDVAAVLACAALEDALKRFAAMNGLDTAGKPMDSIVGALKSKGLVQGAQKSLLDAMPRVRNCAMHADWAKITEPDVNSVIGFVESFLQTKF